MHTLGVTPSSTSVNQVRTKCGRTESGQRQYALGERDQSLGWPERAVKTVDEDQGSSGSTSANREGFKNLMAEIGTGQVGIVFALEASRLAEFQCRLAPTRRDLRCYQHAAGGRNGRLRSRDPNDRLLLGVKGTISEAELFTLKQRLHEGRWNKAKRGELVRSLPVGYIRQENGEVLKDPSQQVQTRVQHIFELFDRLRVARKVVVELVEQKLKIPATVRGGPNHGKVMWKAPELSAIIRMLAQSNVCWSLRLRAIGV